MSLPNGVCYWVDVCYIDVKIFFNEEIVSFEIIVPSINLNFKHSTKV